MYTNYFFAEREEKYMRLKRLLSATLIIGVLLCGIPTSANAAEKNSVNDNDAVVEFDLEKQQGYMGTVESEDFKPLPFEGEKSIKKGQRSGTLSVDADGDAYEPNNTVDTATNYMARKLVSANIHSDTDVDFYKFEVFSDDVNNSVPYSFVLTDIPLGCDYDMYLADENLNAVADLKQGNESEQMLLTFGQQGVYYILIRSADGSYNATSNYKLYYGPTYKNRTTGWKSTNFTFNFPNKNRGVDETNLWSTTGWLIYDGLRTDATIPLGALVESFYLDANGTGTWGGFMKCLIPASNTSVRYEQYGNLSVFDMPKGELLVKQQWAINGYINYAYSFVWKPNICVDYTYPVIIQNMSFVS